MGIFFLAFRSTALAFGANQVPADNVPMGICFGLVALAALVSGVGGRSVYENAVASRHTVKVLVLVTVSVYLMAAFMLIINNGVRIDNAESSSFSGGRMSLCLLPPIVVTCFARARLWQSWGIAVGLFVVTLTTLDEFGGSGYVAV